MYNLGDLSYTLQPRVMPPEVVYALVRRIKDHCLRHGLEEVVLVLHGGEPMLAGQAFFRMLVSEARGYLLPEVTPYFCMQTNGTLLSSKWIDVLVELQIGFGISLDGPQEINDANRVDHADRGSYLQVAEAISRALADRRCKELFGSVLTVVNLTVDPVSLYKHFKGMGLRGVDFLLPDGTYDNPPPGLTVNGADTPYADWLISIFDQWFHEQDPSFSIRLFENVIGLIFGSPLSTDYIGGRHNDVLVIETDGGLEPVDVLKSCGNGFTKLGLNVLANAIDDVYKSELIQTYQQGLTALCKTCQKCLVRDVCGGGYIPHRYSSKNGFSNPSIYCRDLMKMITHIQGKTLGALPTELKTELSLKPLTYDEARKDNIVGLSQKQELEGRCEFS